MTVVVTGFEPFGGLDHNPSAALLDLLPQSIGGHAVSKHLLPVDSSRIAEALSALSLDRARLVIHTGVATDRPLISLERVALNLLDFRVADNAGALTRDRPIAEGAPLALETRLPYRAILDAWAAAKIPSIASTTAGTFLCNQCFYLSLRQVPVRLGFIHLAPDETLAASRGGAYQPLSVQAEAVRIAIEVALAS